ncbi:uncharacterized protein JCM6883_004881 [Sporobolomyces salmoneus]|uniref:uncharacterized protein n=1 Tax=Sporobolomyces salmoneus TaxID=183962 RepID=UPI003181AB7A
MDYEPAIAPHPSYQLEDSSEESDWAEDELPASAIEARRNKMKQLPQEPRVHLEGDTSKLKKGRQVIYLVGEAGERMAQGVEVRNGEEFIQVHIDGEQYGAILPPATEGRVTVVFLATSIQLAYLHPLAEFLLETLAPSSSTILASYHLPSYIPPSTPRASSTAFSSRLPILYLSSPNPSPSSPVASLRSSSTIEPYLPPNLLHGLPSSLLIVSSIVSPSSPTTLLLLPTSTPPTPLNGPFSLLSPVTQPSVTTLYDAGGPVGLSDPSAQFRQLCREKLVKIKQALGWDWWSAPNVVEARSGRTATVAGKGFEWLEKSRKARRKEETSSMFM